MRHIILGVVLVPILFVILQSTQHPEGVLHGLMDRTRSYLFGKETHDQTEEPEVLCTLGERNQLKAVRSTFGSLLTIVHGWPRTGGVWEHPHCGAVELDFLNLSRYEPAATERFSQAEDDFCKRLEYIGARFHVDDHACIESGFIQHNVLKSWYAWPGEVPDGGVWALWATDNEGADIGVSRIRNARTMEERCKIIEMLGGSFYETWEDALRAKPEERNEYDDFMTGGIPPWIDYQ